MAAQVSSCSDSALVSDATASSNHSDVMNSQLVENGLVNFESSEKRKLEINGGVDSNRAHRFKKWKESAVREFPAGCGRFAQKFSPSTSQTDVDMDANVEKLTVEVSKDSCSTSDHVQQETTLEKFGQFNESSKDAVVLKHLEPLKILQREHAVELASPTIDMYPLETPKYMPHLDPFASVSLPESANINDLMQEQSSSHISARRMFPYGCGRNAQKLTEVEEHKRLNSLGHKDGDNSKSLQETSTATKNENEADEAGMENVSNNIPVRPLSENRSCLSDEKTLSGVTDREVSDTSEKRLAKESAASTKRKLAILSCMNSNKDQYHERDPTYPEFFKGKIVVLALMAAQNCPWMRGNVSDESERH